MDKTRAQQLLREIAASGGAAGDAPLRVRLDRPDELIGLHEALLEVAAAHATLQLVGSASTAAGQVNMLCVAWTGREHGGDEVRAAANEAFQAVLQALRPVPRVVSGQWFEVAEGWISHVRMLAERKY